MVSPQDIHPNLELHAVWDKLFQSHPMSSDEEYLQNILTNGFQPPPFLQDSSTFEEAFFSQAQPDVASWMSEVYNPSVDFHSRTTLEYGNVSKGTVIIDSDAACSQISFENAYSLSTPSSASKELSPASPSLCLENRSDISSFSSSTEKSCRSLPSTVSLPPASTNNAQLFHCEKPGCQYAIGRKSFRTGAIRRRHMNTVHLHDSQEMTAVSSPSTSHTPTISGVQRYECPEPGCQRKGPRAFSRKDNLTTHLRGVHDRRIEKRRR